MPGMLQSTVIALDYIRTFPADEQVVSREIFSEMETISMYDWVKVIVICFAGLIGFLVVQVTLSQPNVVTSLIVMSANGFLGHEVINQNVIKKLQKKSLDRIRGLILTDINARNGFEKLKSMQSTILGPNIKKIGFKYSL